MQLGRNEPRRRRLDDDLGRADLQRLDLTSLADVAPDQHDRRVGAVAQLGQGVHQRLAVAVAVDDEGVELPLADQAEGRGEGLDRIGLEAEQLEVAVEPRGGHHRMRPPPPLP